MLYRRTEEIADHHPERRWSEVEARDDVDRLTEAIL
jgi:hypothetical protein